jgi:hypothetical protein
VGKKFSIKQSTPLVAKTIKYEENPLMMHVESMSLTSLKPVIRRTSHVREASSSIRP